MGRYSLEIIWKAKKELAELYKIGNKADLKRLERIFEELEAHPMIGIGSPERLKHQFSGFWSRRINLKDRLIYKIEDKEVIVYIISLKGHYYDK